MLLIFLIFFFFTGFEPKYCVSMLAYPLHFICFSIVVCVDTDFILDIVQLFGKKKNLDI